MLSIYPACFFKEENGYSVIFPDLDDLATCGENLEEAMTMAVDCLAGHLYTLKQEGKKAPTPSAVSSSSWDSWMKSWEKIRICTRLSSLSPVS